MGTLEKEKEIYKEYRDTLETLTLNSKPLIDVLTDVADENKNYARVIVQCIEDQLEKVSVNLKLPILYLIDSIIKCPQTTSSYTHLFCAKLISIFIRMYKEGENEVRTKLLKLRFTWNGALPYEILEILDNEIRKINPAWSPAPHINPKFFQRTAAMLSATNSPAIVIPTAEESLQLERKELQALKQKKIELEEELKMMRPRQPIVNRAEGSRTSPVETTFTVTTTVTPSVPALSTKMTASRPTFTSSSWQAKNATFNNPYVYTKPVINHASTEVLVQSATATTLPTFCTAPVSNRLMNAAITRRVRDPRLCKIEQDGKTLTSDKVVVTSPMITAVPTQTPKTTVKESKPAVTTVRVGCKVDKENVLLAGATSEKSLLAEKTPPNRKVAFSSIDATSRKNGARAPPKKISKTVPLKEPESTLAPTINVDAKDESNIRAGSKTKESRTKTKNKIEAETTNKNTKASNNEDSRESSSENGLDSSIERGVGGGSSGVKGRKWKLKLMAERWANCGDEKKRKFIDELSKVNPKITNKFVRLMESENESNKKIKLATNVDSILIDASKNEPAKKTTSSTNLKNGDSSATDIDTGTKLSIGIGRHTDAAATNTTKSSDPAIIVDEKSSSIVTDSTDRRDEIVKERNDEEDRLRMEMLKLEREEKRLEADIEAGKKNQSSLSKQLEAVMNAGSKTEPLSQNIDIRNLLPTVVNEIISPFTAATPAIETIPSSFINPFGLAKPTKDVDYRQLFAPAFPVPPSPLVVASPAASREMAQAVECEKDDAVLPASKVDCVEMVNDDRLTQRMVTKRRRTTSDSGDNDSYESGRSGDSDNDSGGSKAKRKREGEGIQIPVNDTVMTTGESLQPPMFPFFGPLTNPTFGVISSTIPEVPEANYDILRMVKRDPVKEMDLYGKRREVRHYGSTAVIFLNWDDPRQMTYYNGQRTIIIDNKFKIRCDLNRSDVEKMVYGRPHRFRLGAPTRELYIDGIGYECFFNGPPLQVRFDDVLRSVSLVGREPAVNISKRKRIDLVAGKINIIIDEELAFPVFLDAKPQSIVIDGVPFVIMFIDALKRIVINDVPFRAEFGGLSQSFKFRNKVRCFRLTNLPAGIVPGAINIFQMVMTRLPSPPPLPPSLQYQTLNDAVNEIKPQPDVLKNLNIDELLQKLVASGVVPSSSNNTDADMKSNEDRDEIVKFVDFDKPDTLKQKQPALVTKLYSGIQCSSCGLRFCPNETVKYDQHLDWHFRLNRKSRNGIRVIHSRKWYYKSLDWMKFQEMENTTDREQSWFENHLVVEETEQNEGEIPCVVIGKNDQNAVCDLCRDRFEQFYDQDVEEWLLRNAVQIEDALYHPLCYKDYREKIYRSDTEKIVDSMEPINVDDISVPEEIAISVDNTSGLGKSDDTVSVQQLQDNDFVESKELVTIKQEKTDSPTTATCAVKSEIPKEEHIYTSVEDNDSDFEEIELIEQPIEQIVINDEEDDLEESNLETLNFDDIMAAQSDEMVTDRCEVAAKPATGEDHVEEDNATVNDQHSSIIDITHRIPNLVSIDGNIDMGESMQPMNTATKIKINITKNRAESKSPPLPIVAVEKAESKETESVDNTAEKDLQLGTSFDRQSLSPSIEPTPPEKKQRLKDRKLTEYPPISKGTETSALCTIM